MIQETLDRIVTQHVAARGSSETIPRCRLLREDESIERDRFVESHVNGTLFQLSGWSRAVTETFGHREVCFVAERAGRITGLLPMVVVESRWFGNRLISVPYATGGGAISIRDDNAVLLVDSEAAPSRSRFGKTDFDSNAVPLADAKSAPSRSRFGTIIDDDTEYLVDAAIEWTKEHGCGGIEIRGGAHDHAGFISTDRYVSFERELPTEVDDVLSWLPRKARAAARNARDKFHVTVEWGDELLPIVWKLYAKNMRRLASICYPLRFIENLLRNTPGRHWVSVVKQDHEPVAGLVTFLFRDRVMPYYFGASRTSRQCSAANFAYFKLMERGVAERFRVFDFGRSRRDNTGSFDFKRFHGFEPRPLRHQVWIAPGVKIANLTPSNGRFRAARSIWPLLPLFLTNSISRRLAPHISG